MKMLRFSLGVMRMYRMGNEHIRGTAQVRETRLRWFGHLQRKESGYIGGRTFEMELPAKKGQEKKGQVGCAKRGHEGCWCERIQRSSVVTPDNNSKK